MLLVVKSPLFHFTLVLLKVLWKKGGFQLWALREMQVILTKWTQLTVALSLKDENLLLVKSLIIVRNP